MRIRPVGAYALLLDCSDADQVEAWRAELWRRRERGDLDAVEIIPAARTVLLDGLTDPAHTAALLGTWDPPPSTAAVGTADKGTGTADKGTGIAAPSVGTGGTGTGSGGTDVVEVPVRYDGADLPTVAGHWDVAVPTVVRRLIDTEFRVAFCGFAPGFAYLTGLPVGLAVPRLPTPRPRVPAGSVALAGPYAGIYPTASPGGWLLVGHTDLPLFDVHADPPARLTPGTRVRLVPA
ncbi:allophanate hydrolase subunit 1 [Salinispora sp. H7-4]|uniref:5-oxoprolinase subunit B family protein n=1 Tax=Salinispora sp. H7-4 TaxID=2748321 RepID=UPI0015D2AB42|nr:allophanate hydrolase subunit 1 [Salinispora sp. H7-4]NYT93758.1 allophanate hydrolase subunit 1 [Salinispora sp. H7-4]